MSASRRSSLIVLRMADKVRPTLLKTLSGSAVVVGKVQRILSRMERLGNACSEQAFRDNNPVDM